MCTRGDRYAGREKERKRRSERSLYEMSMTLLGERAKKNAM
jgi:hypothetical protein